MCNHNKQQQQQTAIIHIQSKTRAGKFHLKKKILKEKSAFACFVLPTKTEIPRKRNEDCVVMITAHIDTHTYTNPYKKSVCI